VLGQIPSYQTSRKSKHWSALEENLFASSETLLVHHCTVYHSKQSITFAALESETSQPLDNVPLQYILPFSQACKPLTGKPFQIKTMDKSQAMYLLYVL